MKFWDWILGRSSAPKPQPPVIRVFRNEKDEWMWHARGGNGEIQSMIDNPPKRMDVIA